MPKIIEEEKVFTATVKVFVANGYENTTIKNIAGEAGINEATLYRKYGTKASLIERALEDRLSDTPLDRLVYTGDLNADLLAIVQAHLETHQAHSEILSALLSQVPQHSELKNTLARPLAHIGNVIKIIRQYQMQGLLKEEHPVVTVSTLLGPIIVSQMFERAMGNLPNMVIIPHKYVDHFLHGKSV